jgi:hypothetical protein
MENIGLLISQGLMILLFMLAGVFKLIQSKEKIVSGGGAWAADFTPNLIKMIGLLECVLSLGVLIPLFFSLRVLALPSMIGMGLVMLGAAIVHIRRKEYGFVIFTGILSCLAFFLIYAGLGLWN